MLKVARLDTGPCELFLKLENQNPSGSIKDRIGRSMIEAAEREGKLRPGGTVIEATAGNTGLGLALVAALKGYRLILVVPDKMSIDKVNHLRALGAEVRLTRSDVGRGHPDYYQDVAERLAGEIPGGYWINQFANPANPLAHETGTGPEIWRQMAGRLDAIVCGVGSGGTLTGLGRYFRRQAPEVRMILADPVGSVLADLSRGRPMPAVGSWLVEGIGEDFVPPNCDLSLVAEAYSIDDHEALGTARELLRKEGVLAGSSTGTLLSAALRYCREQTRPKRVVSFVCDTGNKYPSRLYSNGWLAEQGLLLGPAAGNLRDLIASRAEAGEVVRVRPEDTLATAYARLRLREVSQLPVLADGHIVGIIDESDVLLAVHGDAASFQAPVAHYMSGKLEVVPPGASIAEILPTLRADRVAIVVDGERFLGLITKVDLINHLRRKTG
ncbi:MAG: pyridoxal-phosphate dependent enzyme [Alphaproteobacteria bacterium]|nr:pyridoxal-phosphate dependent enzyme [Alphaproteobacteria bacterium]